MWNLQTIAVAAFLSLAVPALAETAIDPVLGAWRLNPGRSALADPPPRSEVRRYALVAGALRVTITEVSAKGESSTKTVEYLLDGKDHALAGSPDYNSVAVIQRDLYTSEAIMKRDGKFVGNLLRVVSSDGKTLTITVKLATAAGSSINEVAVYDRE